MLKKMDRGKIWSDGAWDCIRSQSPEWSRLSASLGESTSWMHAGTGKGDGCSTHRIDREGINEYWAPAVLLGQGTPNYKMD